MVATKPDVSPRIPHELRISNFGFANLKRGRQEQLSRELCDYQGPTVAALFEADEAVQFCVGQCLDFFCGLFVDVRLAAVGANSRRYVGDEQYRLAALNWQHSCAAGHCLVLTDQASHKHTILTQETRPVHLRRHANQDQVILSFSLMPRATDDTVSRVWRSQVQRSNLSSP